jgi:hypothetical protein
MTTLRTGSVRSISKGHFIEVAQLIQHVRRTALAEDAWNHPPGQTHMAYMDGVEGTLLSVATKLADLYGANPLFNRTRFLKACGAEE